MTEYSVSKAIAPFSLVSSSVEGGYIEEVRDDFGDQRIDVINNHNEYYGPFKENSLQSPFTSQWVGGFQHRHISLNSGSDVVNNRPELYHVEFVSQHVRIYNNRNSPPAAWFRGAKSPVNIQNIHTSASSTSSLHVVMGNYQRNYEIVQAPGRYSNNMLKHRLSASISSSGQVATVHSESFGQSISYFICQSSSLFPPLGTQVNTGTPRSNEILNQRNRNRFTSTQISDRKNKSIMVCLFSAPGGIEESQRAALEPASEELAINNESNTRNYRFKRVLNKRNVQSGN